jgi:hypothetical protein
MENVPSFPMIALEKAPPAIARTPMTTSDGCGRPAAWIGFECDPAPHCCLAHDERDHHIGAVDQNRGNNDFALLDREQLVSAGRKAGQHE